MSESSGRIYVRVATAEDQAPIRRMIYRARLNPTGLDWPNFVVAEQIQAGGAAGEGQIVGVGQVKPHRDGSRELASIAVLPAYQRLGIAAVIIHALLARETGAVYLYCADTMPAYYVRFGFVEVGARDLPPAIRRWFRFGKSAVSMTAAAMREAHALHAMRRFTP